MEVSMRQVFNFSAGPAMLPESVLLKAQDEMLNWKDTGMSIMEIGHRTEAFQALMKQIETDLRELMAIPSNYQVLFLTGGATAQFAMVPINLMSQKKSADYVETGLWSRKAAHEAAKFGRVNVAAKTIMQDGLQQVPAQSDWRLSDQADYLHYTPNETIPGLEFNFVPTVSGTPLVADMTSMILSRPINVKDYGVIYASAQKNLGQAGITLVIIRDDLIKEPVILSPTVFHYKTHAAAHSVYNTPPTYSLYIVGLVLSWMKDQGGVKAIHAKNCRNAKKLYDIIDASNDFYHSAVHPQSRSIMNVSFDLPTSELLELFLMQSDAAGLTYLKGHREAGGVRASIYNGMPEEGVDQLAKFMKEFISQYG
jgi:phosphoserine aminotransferase